MASRRQPATEQVAPLEPAVEGDHGVGHTSVLSEYGGETPAVVLYAGTVTAISGAQCLVWASARASKLLEPTVDRAMFFYVLRSLL